jgi:lipoyl(octanoyl) transferase
MSVGASTVATRLTVRHLGLCDYESALATQREIHEQVVAGVTPPTLLLVEHPSVYTAGRLTQPEERPIDGTPVIDVDRGGKITWHGRGQIVGYPIVPLRQRNRVVEYVREVESALIECCKSFGINAEQFCERTGVWVRDSAGDRKLAAIGVRVAKGVTMHGFALNVNPDLAAFSRIIPCGISDADVTSLSAELNRNVSMEEVLPLVESFITQALERVM